MPRTCTVCSHPSLSELNAALLIGESLRNIAKRFGTSVSAAYRHQREYLRAPLVRITETTEAGDADTLMGKVIQLGEEARRLGKKAEDLGDLRGALAAVRELAHLVELMARLQGELTEPGNSTAISVVYVNAPGSSDQPTAPAVSPHIVDVAPIRLEESGKGDQNG